MFGTISCESLKQDNKDLRDEVERRDREESERRDREYYENKERRRQHEQEYQESLCYANDWSDAFQKAIIRLAQEAREEQRDNLKFENHPDWETQTFFTDELNATRRGSEFYREAMTEAETEIEQIRHKAREKAAAKLEQEFPKSTVVEALRENDFESLVNW